MGDKKRMVIHLEVKKLVDVGFVKEVKCQTWVANPILVKKSTGKWRMCVDFTDLNKAFPKDCYPLPCIDQVVVATSGHGLLNFMDTNSGYNQIRMEENYVLHTALYADNDIYHNTVVRFWPINAGATY